MQLFFHLDKNKEVKINNNWGILNNDCIIQFCLLLISFYKMKLILFNNNL